MDRRDSIETKSDFLDTVPRPVVGKSLELADVDDLHPHTHRKAQLLYVVSGVITVTAASGIWTVPPSCAIWIPSGCVHTARVVGAVSVRCLYVEPEVAASLQAQCGIIFVQPLLRELILRFAAGPLIYETGDTREERLVSVLIDELNAAPEEPLCLPMPTDRRLRRIVELCLEDPTLRLTIDEWGARVGASNRTLSRLFSDQTGMPFVKWRQQLHVGLALQKLAAHESVTNIAIDLGYESTSAFIAMFKRSMGTTPSRYFADDHFAATAQPDAADQQASSVNPNVITFPQALAPLSKSGRSKK
jgi:AraC-like DNA-binding protein/mannose-6-phosphate isomerase-like protein (cupin superfamily)